MDGGAKRWARAAFAGEFFSAKMLDRLEQRGENEGGSRPGGHVSRLMEAL